MQSRHFVAATVVALAVIFASVGVLAGDRVPLLPHLGTRHESLYFAPVKYNHTLLGPFSATETESVAHFMVAQWNNPSPFGERVPPSRQKTTPPSPSCSASASEYSNDTAIWSVENDNMRVCVFRHPRAFSVQLAQSGGSNLQCGKEYDLFLSPTHRGTYDVPRIDNNVNDAALGNIDSLNFTFGVDLIDFTAKPRCSGGGSIRCGPSGKVDYAYLTLGLPMSNRVSHQTIFFQILLADTRQFLPACHIDPCNPSRPPSWYFSKLPTLGVNFDLAHVAPTSKCLRKSGDGFVYTLGNELLSALRYSVKEAAEKFGADGNASNWRVGGWYLGSGLQGDATVTSNVMVAEFSAILK